MAQKHERKACHSHILSGLVLRDSGNIPPEKKVGKSKYLFFLTYDMSQTFPTWIIMSNTVQVLKFISNIFQAMEMK